MDSIDFPQLAFDFDELINGSFVQQIFSSSSSSKAESLLLEFILENDHQSPKESSDLDENQKDQKDNDQSLQQQKIHQLKTKLILSLQGFMSHSLSSSSFESEDQQDENNQCQIEFQGLIEKVFSFQQRLRDFSSECVSSVPQSLEPTKSKTTTNVGENHETWHFSFDNWSNSDCQLFLEEIGTRRTTIQSIRNRLQREKKSLCRSLDSIHRSLENSSSLSLSSSDLVLKCRKKVPELSKEETSRLLIGVEMLSLGFGIIQIPQWWIDQEQMKPMEERNLMSINNGSKQVVKWMEKNLFPSIEPQLNEEDKEKIISSIKNNRTFSGCQILSFLGDILSSWRYEEENHLQVIKEVLMTEKQRLFKDLEKQLVIIGNSDYDPEMEDRNIHFFDPISRMQRKLSNQVGTWMSSPPFPSAPSFGIQTTAESVNESLLSSSATMSLKIGSIMDEIKEIKKQHECKQQEDESNQKRIQNNLPPRNECVWDILRSFLTKDMFEICHLSKEEIEKIPEEIKYLNRKDLEWIELEGNQVEWLIDRLCLIFSDNNDREKVREIGLEIRGVSTEELPSLFSKISKSPSLSRPLFISKLKLNFNQLTSLPVEIDQLTNLQTLCIFNNKLRSIPQGISQLMNLQTLDLGFNQLTSIPTEISHLWNLQTLSFQSNQLTCLPVEIGQLTNLQTLNLGFNQLTSIPTEISQLTNLQTLQLEFNQLTCLPAEINLLTNLQNIDLFSNQFTSIPSWIGQLTNLQALQLYQNQLTSIPAWIGQLTNLQRMDLQENQLTSIPAEINQLTNLNYLNLWGNQLRSIPPEIGRLRNLKSLYLGYSSGGNQLSSLPVEIGQLRNLQILGLCKNQLTSIPAEIGQLTNLNYLNLKYNPNLLAEFRDRCHAFYSNLERLEDFYA